MFDIINFECCGFVVWTLEEDELRGFIGRVAQMLEEVD